MARRNRGISAFKDKGFEKIAVVGLSLGGVFSLKLAYTTPVLGVVPMCAPMYIKSEETMYQGILAYAREYKSVSKITRANRTRNVGIPKDTDEYIKSITTINC